MSNQIVDRQNKLAHSMDRPKWGRFKRERFLARMQERYGFSKEKAKEELDRLLLEFYGNNKTMVRYLHPRRDPVD